MVTREERVGKRRQEYRTARAQLISRPRKMHLADESSRAPELLHASYLAEEATLQDTNHHAHEGPGCAYKLSHAIAWTCVIALSAYISISGLGS